MKKGLIIITTNKKFEAWGEIFADIKILPKKQIPLYQKISLKAKQLLVLGMSYQQIAKSLNVGETTIIRACKYERDIEF
ncbi:MAG: hypothetical protein ACYDIA_22500 [Candidatus Humimicrobiaceae bacterium]